MSRSCFKSRIILKCWSRIVPTTGSSISESISNVSSALIMTGIKILSWSMRKFVFPAVSLACLFNEQGMTAN